MERLRGRCPARLCVASLELPSGLAGSLGELLIRSRLRGAVQVLLSLWPAQRASARIDPSPTKNAPLALSPPLPLRLPVGSYKALWIVTDQAH